MSEEQRGRFLKLLAWAIVFSLAALIIYLVIAIVSPNETPPWLGVDSIIDGEGKTAVYAKTLWDLLELLLIPVALALIAYLFAQSEKQADLKRSEEKARLEHALQIERLEAATLDSYFDGLSELLLDKDLKGSAAGDGVRNIARVRTLFVLRQVNGKRKGSVVRALSEANLVNVSDAIVLLAGADLRNVELAHAGLADSLLARVNAQKGNFERSILNNCNLNRANLTGANLQSAQLRNTEMERVNLERADLRRAFFDHANLVKADLVGANLSGTILKNSNLKGANCSEACLLGTDWSSCDLEGIALDRARYDASTKWPDQFDLESTGAICVDS